MKLSIRIPLLIGIVVFIGTFSIIFTVEKIVRSTLEKSILSGLNSEVYANARLLETKLEALTAPKDDGKVLSGLVAELKTAYKSGYAFLVNNNGTVIAHKTAPSTESLSEVMVLAMKNKTGVAKYSYKDKDMICAYAEIPGYPWLLFLTIEEEEVGLELSKMSYTIISIGFLCLICGIIAALIIGRSIAKPIVHVVNALKNITNGEGDLTQSIPVEAIEVFF